jgi:hypothetical protein
VVTHYTLSADLDITDGVPTVVGPARLVPREGV